ncbi:MAG: helix-turn-helix domain-containing protein, partial [Chloroflexi bacterium]|nr:helix-turn-helix domain-containing protein [Chloroflexota bacterium]
METIARIARVLNLVGTLPSGLTLSEISEALSLPKSTTFRMLQAL